MNEEPKSATDIGRFLNRDDSSNILYALRKLEKAGLIEKGDSPLRQTTYQVTERGMEMTDRYAEVRREVLLANLGILLRDEGELAAAIKTIWRVCGLYEQGARSMSMMRVLQGDPNTKTVQGKPSGRRQSSGANKVPKVARKTPTAGR